MLVLAKDELRPFPESAPRYSGAGLHPMPISPRSKRAIQQAWQRITYSADWLVKYHNAGIALRCGIQPCGANLFMLDEDTARGIEALEARYGELPDTARAVTGSGKLHVWFQAPPGVRIKTTTNHPAPGIDVRGEGGYALVEPSIHPDTGQAYGWLDLDIETMSISDFAFTPDWLLALVRKPDAAEQAAIDEGSFNDVRVDAREWHEVRHALSYVDPRCDYDRWLHIGMGLHYTGHPDAFEAWDQWSRGDLWHEGPVFVGAYPERGIAELAYKWRSFSR